MRMIEINALDNGAHDNQSYHGILPEGWAVLPDTIVTENFPFGTPTVEEIDGVMTVTQWVPGIIPEPEIGEPIKEEPSQLDIIEAQVTYTAMMTNTLLEV